MTSRAVEPLSPARVTTTSKWCASADGTHASGDCRLEAGCRRRSGSRPSPSATTAASYRSVADSTQPQTLKERERLRLLDNAGDAGMTAAEFASTANIGNNTARRALDDFVAKGWATEDSSEYPASLALDRGGTDRRRCGPAGRRRPASGGGMSGSRREFSTSPSIDSGELGELLRPLAGGL